MVIPVPVAFWKPANAGVSLAHEWLMDTGAGTVVADVGSSATPCDLDFGDGAGSYEPAWDAAPDCVDFAPDQMLSNVAMPADMIPGTPPAEDWLLAWIGSQLSAGGAGDFQFSMRGGAPGATTNFLTIRNANDIDITIQWRTTTPDTRFVSASGTAQIAPSPTFGQRWLRYQLRMVGGVLEFYVNGLLMARCGMNLASAGSFTPTVFAVGADWGTGGGAPQNGCTGSVMWAGQDAASSYTATQVDDYMVALIEAREMAIVDSRYVDASHTTTPMLPAPTFTPPTYPTNRWLWRGRLEGGRNVELRTVGPDDFVVRWFGEGGPGTSSNVVDVNQGTAALQPKLKNDGNYFLDFTGTEYITGLSGSGSWRNTVGERTIVFFVFKIDSAYAVQHPIIASQVGSRVELYVLPDGTIAVSDSAAVFGNPGDVSFGDKHLAVWNTAKSTALGNIVYVDGGAAKLSGAGGTFNGGAIQYGKASFGTPFQLKVYEHWMMDAQAIAPADLNTVINEIADAIAAYHGLTWTAIP